MNTEDSLSGFQDFFFNWPGLCIEHVYVLTRFMYWTCLCIEHVYVLNMIMYWTCLCIEHVYVLNMFMYWTGLCIEQVYVLNRFMYWTCLCIKQVYVLNRCMYWTGLCIERNTYFKHSSTLAYLDASTTNIMITSHIYNVDIIMFEPVAVLLMWKESNSRKLDSSKHLVLHVNRAV